MVPDTTVTTASIERMLSQLYRRVGLADGFVETMTGVRARRFWDEGMTPSEAATRVSEKVLSSTGLSREHIDVLINTSVSREGVEPSTASLVHGDLGLGRSCVNFDLSNACLGFLSGMESVANRIELGQARAGLVVAAESSRHITRSTLRLLMEADVALQDLVDNMATLTLGSGAVAMVLVHEDLATHGHRLQGGVSLAATEHNRLCHGTEEQMRTEPARLLVEGVHLAEETFPRYLEHCRLDPSRIAEFALHQVSKANHEALVEALNLPDDRCLRLYPDLGNVGAAGVPMTLARLVEAGRVSSGDTLGLLGIGSGINCTMMAVEW
jgi:3-oxoacyl-[acyl-carrier-protein] synthase-3